MKKSKRNFVILGALLCGVVYGTFLVASSTTVPVREKSTPEKSALYLRSLERRLYVLVEKKQFPEPLMAELFWMCLWIISRKSF